MRRFTADASHEPRSPLTVIRTAVDVALARDREAANYQGVLRSGRSTATTWLEQLLLLAQADAGSLRPMPEEIDVADLVEELAARWRGAAEGRQIRVVAEIPDTGTITADPDLLRRAFDNLVDNAIRHSPALAQVTIAHGAWTISGCSTSPTRVRESPEDLRETVFQRFARADSVCTRRGGGAGLGLALGAAIAQTHHGQVTLAMRAEPGTVFQLRLPAAQAPA